ncbi:MAG TPA: HAD family phosphatase [Dehalococcoidia bacterium]|nr:HAD family phosphatase [Dehalococcoidia bacterium]
MGTAAALLWDLDGVLVDSAAFHYRAFRQVLAELGHHLDEETFRRSLLGLRNDAILRRVLGELPPEQLQELARRKEEAFRRLIEGRVQPLPGARELALAAGERGLLQAIVSSTPRQNVVLVLRALGLEEAFATVVAEEDVARGKPDPEGFLLAAQRLGVSPQVCTVIEDAPEGIQAAKAAGMRCLAVATTRPPQMLSQADLVVPALADPAARRFLLDG